VALSRDQTFDRPLPERLRIPIAVCVHGREFVRFLHRIFDWFVLLIANTEGGSTALDFTSETAFRDVTLTNAVRILLEMKADLFDTPAAANKVAYDAVKRIAAVGAIGSAVPHDTVDFINAVAPRRAGIAAIFSLGILVLAPFSPAGRAIEQGIDIAELTARPDLQPGDGQRLAGAPEEFERSAIGKAVRCSGSPLAVPQMRKPVPLGLISA
jgi:hypothetical protein